MQVNGLLRAGAAVGVLSADALGNYCILICAALLLPVLALFVADSIISARSVPSGGRPSEGGAENGQNGGHVK